MNPKKIRKIIYNDKVSKETFWALFSKIISSFSNLFLLIFIPRVAGIEVYGSLSLIIAYIYILGIFFGTPIQEGVKKEITQNKFSNISKKYFFEGFRLKVIFSLLATLLLFSALSFIDIQILKQNFLLFITLCTIMNLWGLVVNSIEAVHRLFYECLIYFIEYSIKLIFILYFYFFSILNLQNLLYSFIFGYFFAFLIGFFIFITKFKKVEFYDLFKMDKTISKRILNRSFFLALISLSFIIFTKVDSIMISFFLTVNDVGFYNISSDITKNTTIISVPLIIGVIPMFARLLNKELFYKILKKLFLVNISIFIVLFFSADYLITLLYGPEFGDSISVLRILAIFPLLASNQYLIQGILILKDKTKIIFIYSFIGVIFNILCNILLIPIVGISGAAIATILSYSILTFLCFFYFKSNFF